MHIKHQYSMFSIDISYMAQTHAPASTLGARWGRCWGWKKIIFFKKNSKKMILIPFHCFSEIKTSKISEFFLVDS